MRTVKEEVDLSDYESYTDAVRQIGHFLSDVYMHKRIYWSLGWPHLGRIRKPEATMVHPGVGGKEKKDEL